MSTRRLRPLTSGILSKEEATFIQKVNDGLEYGANINEKTDYGATLLMIAAEKGYAAATMLLLRKGADASLRDLKDHERTACMIAANYGKTEAVRILIRNGIYSMLEEEDANGYTALDIAVRGAHFDAARLLLDEGADLLHHNKGIGSTSLSDAIFFGYTEIARLLIERGADVNARDNQGWTPLMYAANRSDPEQVRLLLDNGADPKAKSDDGTTAFSRANTSVQNMLAKSEAPHLRSIQQDQLSKKEDVEGIIKDLNSDLEK